MSSVRGIGLAPAYVPLEKTMPEKVDSETLNESAKAKAFKEKPDTRDPRVLKAAQMYESQFLRYMLAEMRKTVPESEFMAPNQAEKIFKEQLDDKYVDNWVEKGGVGMSNLIYDQIMERFAPHAAQRPHGLQMANPNGMPMMKDAAKDSSGVNAKAPALPVESSKMKSEAVGKTLQFDFQIEPGKGTQPVVSPWSGKVSEARQVDHQSLVRLEHENGLQSLLQFDGMMTKQPGDSLAAGEKLGQLSLNSESLLWRINSES